MAAKKSKGVIDAAAQESTRLNVHLSREAHRRLSVHALMGGETPGKIVERLINTHLREWRIQANPSVSMDRPAHVESISLESLPAA